MRLDEQIGWYVCETLSLWPPFKPWNCGCRLSRKRLRFRFGQNSWSKWYGSVIIEVDIHERPGSTGVSKSRRKINVRVDNQSGILMTLKNHAGFYYFSLFLGLITCCCSGKWALTHWAFPPPHTPHPLLWKSYSGRIKDRTWKTAEIEPSKATVLMIISLDGDVQFIVGLVSSLSIQRGCKRTYAVWEKV